MKQLLLFTSATSLLMSMLCALAITAAQRLPSPLPYALGYCDDAPCVMNVTPGVSEWQSISERYRDNIANNRVLLRPQAAHEVAMYPSVDGEHIGRIYLHFGENANFEAGWLVQRFGQPCGVSIYQNMNTLTLRYPFLLANIVVDDNRLHPHARVRSVFFNDPAYVSPNQPDLCVDNVTSGGISNRVWQGFAPLHRYLRHYAVYGAAT